MVKSAATSQPQNPDSEAVTKCNTLGFGNGWDDTMSLKKEVIPSKTDAKALNKMDDQMKPENTVSYRAIQYGQQDDKALSKTHDQVKADNTVSDRAIQHGEQDDNSYHSRRHRMRE